MSNPEESVDQTNEVESELKKITDQMRELRERMEENLIPAKTTSFDGFGVMMLDYRPVEDGNFEATRWFTLCFVPIIPLSVWKIKPRKYKYDRSGEQQLFNLLEKKRLTLTRMLYPYLIIVLGVLPFVLSYHFSLDLNPFLRFVGRNTADWVPVGIIILLIILTIVWIGFILTRIHNAEKAYKD